MFCSSIFLPTYAYFDLFFLTEPKYHQQNLEESQGGGSDFTSLFMEKLHWLRAGVEASSSAHSCYLFRPTSPAGRDEG